MTLQKMVQEYMPHMEKAIHSHLIDILSEKHPDNNYSHAPGGGIQMWEEDADVQQHLDYYAKKRKTKPTVMDNADALMKQEKSMADGTFAENHITPDIYEEVFKRFSNSQQYLPKRIQHKRR